MNTKPLYLKQILNFIKKRQSVINKIEVINLLDAEDKILAENIYSKINLPPFKNSAVDGYALLKQDLNKMPKKTFAEIFKKKFIQEEKLHFKTIFKTMKN